MSQFDPTDSKCLRESYTHPRYTNEPGQGVYVMITSKGELKWCPSGNELKRIYELNPELWLTGPIWLPLSPEDHSRIMKNFEDRCNRF